MSRKSNTHQIYRLTDTPNYEALLPRVDSSQQLDIIAGDDVLLDILYTDKVLSFLFKIHLALGGERSIDVVEG